MSFCFQSPEDADPEEDLKVFGLTSREHPKAPKPGFLWDPKNSGLFFFRGPKKSSFV